MPTATHAYLRITGKHQGVFKGAISRPGRGDNWMELLAFETTPAHDKPSGSLLGKRQHGTLTIIRVCADDATLFFKALATKEPLPEVEIEFTNQHGNGAVFIQNNVTLTNATLVQIDKTPPASSPLDRRGSPIRHHEYLKISFIYAQIEWQYQPSEKGLDSWNA
jgi:type VI secretion system Hcp family effector